MRRRTLVGVSLAVLVMAGCARDYLGWEQLVSNQSHIEKEAVIEDDRIEDKHPLFVEGLETVERFGDCLVRMNKSGQVTQLSLPELAAGEGAVKGALFPGRAEAMAELEGYSGAQLIPSLEMVFGATKPFNDGLYAGIEMNLQFGAGEWGGKRAFLEALDARLAFLREGCIGVACDHIDAARVHVLSGLTLGGAQVAIPDALASAVAETVAAFEAHPLFAKPMGFYNWSTDLQGIFMQDRFFQNYLEDVALDPEAGESGFGKFVALAVALESDEALAGDYATLMGLYEVLTNPYAHYSPRGLMDYVEGLEDLGDVSGVAAEFSQDHADLGTPCGPRFALFPSSKTKETVMYEELYCNVSPPSDVTIIDIFINQIRSGDIDLTPAADSGWYDYQTFALETLLVPENGPESDHLMLTAAYKKKLIDTFKSILTQNRETHVKQTDIAIGMGAAAPSIVAEVDLFPRFASEPFPTFYLRTARAYRFLAEALEARLGADFLAVTGRLREDGSMDSQPLLGAIRDKARFLYGLYLISADALGMERALLADELLAFPEADSIALAENWLATWTTDVDMLSDPRVIAPVALDAGSGMAIYWAIIGVRALKAKAEFAPGFEPQVVSLTPAPDADVQGCEFRSFVEHHYWLLTEKQVEVRIPAGVNPPTRDELRALCDEHETEAAIVEALQAWQG